MLRFRRLIYRWRASLDPLTSAVIVAGLALVIALAVFFSRPTQRTPQAAGTDAAITTTIPKVVTAGRVADPSSTTSPLTIAGTLPLTGAALPPPTTTSASSTTTARSSVSSAGFSSPTAPPSTEPPSTAPIPPPPTVTTLPPQVTTTTTTEPPSTTTSTTSSTTTTTSTTFPVPTLPWPAGGNGGN